MIVAPGCKLPECEAYAGAGREGNREGTKADPVQVFDQRDGRSVAAVHAEPDIGPCARGGHEVAELLLQVRAQLGARLRSR